MTIALRKFLNKFSNQSAEGRVFRSTSSMMLIQPVGLAISFFLSVFLARVMGADSFGIYFFVLAYLQIFVLVAQLGLKTSLLRFVPEYFEKQDWAHLKGILRGSTQVVLASALVIGFLAGGVSFILKERLGLELSLTFWLAMLLLPVMALLQIRGILLRSFKTIVKAALPESILRPLLFAGLIATGFFVTRSNLSADLVMLFLLIASLLTLLLSEVWLRGVIPQSVKAAVVRFDTPLWLRVSLPVFALDGLFFAMKRIDSIMLGGLTDTTQVGFYGAASRVSDLAYLGLVAANMLVAPMIGGLYNSGKFKELQRALTSSARMVLVITLFASLALIVAGKFVLGLFGMEFKVAYLPLVILVIGQALSALTGTVGHLMSLTNHHNQAARFIGLAVVVNIVLNALLIPRFGMTGAAVATLSSMMVWNSIGLFYVVRNLRLNPTVLPLEWLKRKA